VDNFDKFMLFLILSMFILAIRFDIDLLLNSSAGMALGISLFYFKQVYNDYKIYKKIIGK
jgi:hypothetical protein